MVLMLVGMGTRFCWSIQPIYVLIDEQEPAEEKGKKGRSPKDARPVNYSSETVPPMIFWLSGPGRIQIQSSSKSKDRQLKKLA